MGKVYNKPAMMKDPSLFLLVSLSPLAIDKCQLLL